MLLEFFYTLRDARLPVNAADYLTLLRALRQRVIAPTLDEFYYLARITFVKDEKHFDRFDRAFGAYFQRIEPATNLAFDVPSDRLQAHLQQALAADEKARIEEMGGFELLIERLKQQPFRASTPHAADNGNDPEEDLLALKTWDAREHRDYDEQAKIGVRTIQLALRRLRRFAREGAQVEFDLPSTIRSTTAKAGLLDIKMRPRRRNAVKVLALFDVSHSMEPYATLTKELFSALKTEFKHLECYYFQHSVADFLWNSPQCRDAQRISTHDVLHTYPSDYKLIFISDALNQTDVGLHPDNPANPGAAETHAVWLQRFAQQFPSHVGLNPALDSDNEGKPPPSVLAIGPLLAERIYPLTLAGLEKAIRILSR